jgi:hypothetical protein
VGFGDISFQTRQRIGIWGELTLFRHFSEHVEHGLLPLTYGEASPLKKKATNDAVCRPDILFIERSEVPRLLDQGIDVKTIDLRLLPDADPTIEAVLDSAFAAIEVKFSHREYRKGRVNFIIDEVRKERYERWLSRTHGIGSLMAWFTTNKAFMAPTDRVLTEGISEERTYETIGRAARTKTTVNLPVEEADFLADVIGYDLNQTFKPRLVMNENSGGISFDVDDPLVGDLENVNIARLRKLAASVRRD